MVCQQQLQLFHNISVTYSLFFLQKRNTMSGQRLMCVWQAVYAMDTTQKGKASKNRMREITASFTQNNMIRFSAQEFDTFFAGRDDIDFDKYRDYVSKNLSQSATTFTLVEDAIETMCWERCKPIYNLKKLTITESDARKIWEVYNRLCEPGTVPPSMEIDEVVWVGEKLATQLGQHLATTNIPRDMCYGELIQLLDNRCFSKAAPESAQKAIDDLHSWLVREVSMTGRLYKRTRKQANWTSWLKRWFVLSPGMLVYYDGQRLKEKKGEVIINSFTKLEPMDDFKSLGRRLVSRFKVSNSPDLEMELSAADDPEKRAWMAALVEVVEAAKSGTTPVQAVLKERVTQKKGGKKVSVEQATARLSSVRLREGRRGSHDQAPIPQKMPAGTLDCPNVNPDEVKLQMARIQQVFCQVDKNGNGSIDAEEFHSFIKGLGLKMSDKDIDDIFTNIEVSDDKIITLDEFQKFFMNNVLDEGGVNESGSESHLRAAFLRADRDGTGTVDFREFAEYIWEERRSMRLSGVMKAFDKMDRGGEGAVSFDTFKNFFDKQRNSLEDEEKPSTLAGHLQHMYEVADVARVAEFLRERWSVFASFKRLGASGDLVMTGGHGMVADVLPGQYNLVDLACFSDLPPITPRHLEVHSVKWVTGQVGSHGRAIFPPDFSGVLPVEIATTEHLRYYGASLADSTQIQVSLMYRHGIQDFTYENRYLEDYVKSQNGGAGIEQHDFAHLDCPMEGDSGFFVMAKIEGDVMHLTAFQVPRRHTLYVPGGTLHSNDYLKGTWRTMLSDEADIDHVHLMKRRRKNNDNDLEAFSFSFKQ